jgi:hypothetical protein
MLSCLEEIINDYSLIFVVTHTAHKLLNVCAEFLHKMSENNFSVIIVISYLAPVDVHVRIEKIHQRLYLAIAAWFPQRYTFLAICCLRAYFGFLLDFLRISNWFMYVEPVMS